MSLQIYSAFYVPVPFPFPKRSRSRSVLNILKGDAIEFHDFNEEIKPGRSGLKKNKNKIIVTVTVYVNVNINDTVPLKFTIIMKKGFQIFFVTVYKFFTK